MLILTNFHFGGRLSTGLLFYEVLRLCWCLLISKVPKCSVVQQLVRQLVLTMLIINDHTLFHLWWKKIMFYMQTDIQSLQLPQWSSRSWQIVNCWLAQNLQIVRLATPRITTRRLVNRNSYNCILDTFKNMEDNCFCHVRLTSIFLAKNFAYISYDWNSSI